MDTDPKEVTPAGGTDESPELLRKLSGWTAKAAQHWKPFFKRMKDEAEYAYGEVETEVGEPGDVRVNIVHSTIMGLLPHVYAKNPEVSFSPSEGVQQGQLPAVKAFSTVLQTAVQRSFRAARLKRQVKANTRTALTRRLAWFKVAYQRDYAHDPVIHARIADTQDNLARLDRLILAAQEEGPRGLSDHQAEREELADVLRALQAQPEVVVAEGLTVDRVQPNHLILDPGIADLDSWRQGRRVVEIVWMARDEAEEKFARSFEKVSTWTWRQVRDAELSDGEKRAREVDTEKYGHSDQMVKVYEAWDRSTLHVYTWLQGDNDWAREPWAPSTQGEGWYPYFDLAFHRVDGHVMPLSLVQLLRTLQDEHNDTRTQQAEHREVSIPTWVAATTTDRNTLRRHKDRVLGEVVLVDARGVPINQVIQRQEPPAYNPALYDTSPIRVDIEMLSGLSDAQRGSIHRAKTLGEAKILEQGVASRTDELRDTIEDTIEEMAKYAAEVLVLELTPQQAARLAGPMALMSWPAADKAELFAQVNVDVRAGTSGKPDQAQEQETWATLLPIIEKLQEQIVGLFIQGIDPMHKVELLRQTVRRFDETIEVESLLPQQIVTLIRQQDLARLGGMAPAFSGLGAPGAPAAPPDNVIPMPAREPVA